MNTIPPRARFIAPRLWLAVALCSIAAALASLALAGAGSAGWTVIASPNVNGDSDHTLQDVTCVSASDCWAVGNFSGSGPLRTLIQHWDGASWSIVPSPNVVATGNNQHNQLLDVACSSASECWAVGTYRDQEIDRTLILRWNGSAWSIIPSPNASSQGNLLVGVTCTSANDCWAVGGYNDAVMDDVSATLIQRWNGSAWSIVPSPNYSSGNPALPAINGLSDVTCTSASDCWAVGGYKEVLQPSRTLIARWNGTAWALVPSPNTGPDDDNGLAAVTCSSASDCWAVGSYDPPGSGGKFPKTLIARWNGTAWTVVPSGDPGTGRTFGSVTCPAASECWAVGSHIERWDGSSWSVFPSPSGGSGVTCSSTAECWSVSQRSDAGSFRTLILRYSTSAIQASAAVSRKTHGGAPFDINLPLTGTPGIECRTGGANNDHQVILTFPVAVSFASADVTSGAGEVSSTSGTGTAQVTVNLTGVTDAQTITLTLFGVNDGSNTNEVSVQMGVLLGDTSADRVVNSADITQTRRESGRTASLSNFRADTSVDGVINSADITTVRRASGTSLPSP